MIKNISSMQTVSVPYKSKVHKTIKAMRGLPHIFQIGRSFIISNANFLYTI